MAKKQITPKNSFEYKTETINHGKGYPSDCQHRVYGLVEKTSQITNNCLAPMSTNHFTYMAQSGMKWQEKSKKILENRLKQSMHGGRLLEIFLVENLIERENDIARDWIPPLELDLSYKIDMMSRIPLQEKTSKKLSSFCIATQITVAQVEPITDKRYISPEQDVYTKKFFQTQMMADGFENPFRRKEIEENFGKIHVPDVLCFLAVNGQLGKFCSNSSGIGWYMYNQWQKSGFRESSLSSRLKPKNKIPLDMIGEFVRWTQTEALVNYKNPPKENEILQRNGYFVDTQYNQEKSILECTLFYCDEDNFENPYEKVAKISYFIGEHAKKKFQNHTLLKK